MARFLCVCDHGNCRSYALARILKYSGHEAIAVGQKYSNDDTLWRLGEWADHIVVMTYRSDRLKDLCPSEKLLPTVLRVDEWGNPFHAELESLLINYATDMMKDLGLPPLNPNMSLISVPDSWRG